MILGRPLAGSFPGTKSPPETAAKLQVLFDTGIRCIVNPMVPDERYHNGDLFGDYPIGRGLSDVNTAIETIRRLRNGGDAEVHRRSFKPVPG